MPVSAAIAADDLRLSVAPMMDWTALRKNAFRCSHLSVASLDA